MNEVKKCVREAAASFAVYQTTHCTGGTALLSWRCPIERGTQFSFTCAKQRDNRYRQKPSQNVFSVLDINGEVKC